MRPRYRARRFITKFTKISKIKFNEPIYFLLVHIPTHILYALLSDYVIHHFAGAHLRAKTRNERKKKKRYRKTLRCCRSFKKPRAQRILVVVGNALTKNENVNLYIKYTSII